ncbi:hypothetical protein EJ05DRAFT_496775 [Pseudovirgaria hyperparasitica]|uniref:PAS domain-containing protein n=1 Tax=Pseudovirgaria hyperparasitica TaxID=470096 RepID=A0A6A6WGF1_9PEZI|nr:uncharacterized protein EJ05DRAFT_496775 [Pseudovirgaria hyperparasitica]KAF2761888.1 hypothetical protein EJ05DRAFT_496775 [Pseudovirgaria hyperparasitica]
MSPAIENTEFDDQLLRDDAFDDLQAPGQMSPRSSQSVRAVSIFDGYEEDSNETDPSQDMDQPLYEEPPPGLPQSEAYDHDKSRYHEPETFDLRPPPPTVTESDAEMLAERLFSVDHLKSILEDHALFHKFTIFLNRYQPQLVPLLIRYLDSQKAIAAARYANAIIAQRISMDLSPRGGNKGAVSINPSLEDTADQLLQTLVEEALPVYITHQLTQVVTECLVKEITGSNTPIMQDLVQGVAEVYCMTDPTQPDNPIVYCSEEFTRTTQYGRKYTIGKNCRFLQGPKSSQATLRRIKEAIDKGQELCETLLNYRREGTPFLNLLLVAPLHDNNLQARYFIGCQVDVTNLVDGGRGLESFQRLLMHDRLGQKEQSEATPKESLKHLRMLGRMLSDEELRAVQQDARGSAPSTRPNSSGARKNHHPNHKYVGLDDDSDEALYPPARFGSSGRLPGVYKNYLLVRPSPSLRIVFTSASLRVPGLLQSNFLSRVGGPAHVRAEVAKAFDRGVGVTAKIQWLHGKFGPNIVESKTRWIHCTPLLGSDNKVGVWMVVMVEREDFTGRINGGIEHKPQAKWRPAEDSGMESAHGRDVSKAENSRLYAQYLRQQGRNSPSMMSDRGGVGEEPRRQHQESARDRGRDRRGEKAVGRFFGDIKVV